jgi:hypothetical protein
MQSKRRRNGFHEKGDADMGYFDALTSGSFKTAPDGGRLFFPWGIWGRGYALASEQDYQRLQRQIKIYYIVSMALIIGPAVANISVAVIIAALLLGFYLVWMLSLLHRLQPSDERLSLQESMTTQAHLHSAAGLWLLEIVALAFVCGGVLILIFDRSNWLIALPSIGFFGLCAAVFARMLVLRAHAGAPRPGEG